MKYSVTTLSAAAIALMGSSHMAIAQACTLDDTTYTCAGTGAGIDNDVGTGFTVDVLEGALINDGDAGIRMIGNNTITNDGTIGEGAGGNVERGIRIRDGNTIVNNGIIDVADDGIFRSTSSTGNNNTVVHTGTLIGRDDQGIRLRDGNTITNTGTIIGGNRGIDLRDGNTLTNDATITGEGNDGLKIRSNNTVTNNGVIRADNGVAIMVDPDNDVGNRVINSGQLVGDTVAVQFSDQDDSFVWTGNSSVTGTVRMGGGTDTLEIQSTNSFGVARFEDVEEVIIGNGSAAFVEQLTGDGDDDYLLYTASTPSLSAPGQMVGNLALRLTDRLLASNGMVARGMMTTETGQGDWWAIGNFTFQEDRGQGYDLNTQGITAGRKIAGFDVFVGLENGDAEVTNSDQSTTQQMLYAGATSAFALNDTMEIVGLAVLGTSRNEYDTGSSATDNSGNFGAVSGRFNIALPEITFGAYAGLSKYSEGSVSIDGIDIGSRDYDSTYGGIELRSNGIALPHGINMQILGGFGCPERQSRQL